MEDTVAIVAVKLALTAPAATATVAGTVTAALSLVRFTTNPPLGAAPVRATVHASGADPVIALLVQLSELKVVAPACVPIPSSPICMVEPSDAFVAISSWPVAAPIAEGLNPTLMLNEL